MSRESRPQTMPPFLKEGAISGPATYWVISKTGTERCLGIRLDDLLALGRYTFLYRGPAGDVSDKTLSEVLKSRFSVGGTFMRCFSAAVMALLSFCVVGPVLGQENPKTFTYAKTKEAELKIVVHFPPEWKETDKRPGIVFFFGGGWENGTLDSFARQAKYFAGRGMVAALADYRVKSRHGVTPKECVDDARSAVRWFRQNAGTLGVDPDRIVASGGSAGGHIAACTTLRPSSEPDDPKDSSKANALILFNPVLRFGPQMLTKIDNDAEVGKAISPVLHLKKDSPPTLLMFGTDDFLYRQGQEFIQRSKEVGNRAEMLTAEGQPHGFFHRSPWYRKRRSYQEKRTKSS